MLAFGKLLPVVTANAMSGVAESGCRTTEKCWSSSVNDWIANDTRMTGSRSVSGDSRQLQKLRVMSLRSKAVLLERIDSAAQQLETGRDDILKRHRGDGQAGRCSVIKQNRSARKNIRRDNRIGDLGRSRIDPPDSGEPVRHNGDRLGRQRIRMPRCGCLACNSPNVEEDRIGCGYEREKNTNSENAKRTKDLSHRDSSWMGLLKPFTFQIITHSEYPGWWAKIDLFPPKERIVYLDLDIVICANVDFLFDYQGSFAMLRESKAEPAASPHSASPAPIRKKTFYETF